MYVHTVCCFYNIIFVQPKSFELSKYDSNFGTVGNTTLAYSHVLPCTHTHIFITFDTALNSDA